MFPAGSHAKERGSKRKGAADSAKLELKSNPIPTESLVPKDAVQRLAWQSYGLTGSCIESLIPKSAHLARERPALLKCRNPLAFGTGATGLCAGSSDKRPPIHKTGPESEMRALFHQATARAGVDESPLPRAWGVPRTEARLCVTRDDCPFECEAGE